MKCSVFVTLALALTAAALPRGGGGGRNRGGNKGASSSSAAAAGASSATSAAGGVATASASSAASSTDTAAGSAATASSTNTAAGNGANASATATAAGAVNTVTSATANNADIQNSLTLDSSVISSGFLNNGQATPEAGQVASLTSGNNFINFCATSKLPLTNGLQVTGGSCNPAPMGEIPSTANMVSAKFTNPINGQTLAANTAFTISVAMSGLNTGFFVNAKQNYFAAPQQLNAQGQIQGHSHVVVEQLDSLTQTTPTDPTKFAFFKGLNAAAVNGVLTADVTAGLPAGVYKVSTINTAANHQPVLLPVAQHGSPEDAVYFTVTADGTPAANSAFGGANSSAAAGAASTSAAAAGASTAAAGAASTSAAAAGASTSTSAAAAAANTSAASSAAAAPSPLSSAAAAKVAKAKAANGGR